MKKQKFCYSRFLSIILSLALLCSALVFPVSVNAATDKDTVATALKTAWQNMYAAKGETFAYPNAIRTQDGWVDCLGEGDRTLLPSEDPRLELYSDIDLRKYDNTHDVFVGYGKEIHQSETVPYCNINIFADDKGSHKGRTGFYFYVYAENVTKDIKLKLNLDWYGNTNTLSTETVTIPAGTNGYIRLKDTDFFPDGFHSVIKNTTIYTMWVKVLSSFDTGAKLKFGSFQWVNSNHDLGLDNLSNDELLVSALKLHTENVYYPEYVERFETALSDLKAYYDAKDLAVLELKAAWEEMETNSGVWGTYYDSTYTGVEEITLGSTKYYKLNTANLADTSNTGYTAKTRLYLSDQSKWKPVSDYGDGFYFYIYANEDIKAPITIAMHGGMIDGTNIKNGSYDLYYTIPAGTKAGTYIKVSDRDLFTEGYKTFKDMFETSGGQNTFAFFFTSHGDGEISFGPAYYYTRVTSSDATGVNFVNAADALDISSYGNTEAFTAALANAKAAYADELTASDLRAAFIDMLPKEEKSTGYTKETINAMTNDELLVAATSLHTNYGVYDAAKLATFKTALEAFKAANYTPEAAARITLKAAYGALETKGAQYSSLSTNEWWGAKQANVTTSTTTANTPERENLGTRYAELGSGKEFTAGSLIVMQQDAGGKPPISTYDGFYFYIQVTDKLTQDFKFGAVTKFTISSSDCENICVLPKDTEPGYYLFTDKDFYSQGYSVAKSTHGADVVTVLLPSDYSGGNIRIGAVFGYKCAATVPEGSDTWSLEKFANHTVNYIADKSYIISDDFRKLFADAQKLGAGVYNGDFANDGAGFKFVAETQEPNSDPAKYYQSYFDADNKKIVVENLGWKGSMLENKVVIEPNTDYVLTYRFKASAKADWIRSGINLVGNNESLDSSKISMTVSSNAELGDNNGWAPTRWINGIKHTVTNKLVNVAVRFNSGDNDYLNMSMAFQSDCNYTYDYFKLTKAVDVEKGNVNGDSEVDILDLVRLKRFLNDGDTQIAFEAAKVHNTGETVNNDDFNALRSKLLEPTV